MSAVCGTGSGNFPQPGDPDLNGSILNASPAFGGIDVVWTYPGLNPQAVAHTILFRSTNADPATKVQHRIVTGNFHYNKVDPGQNVEYFYWIQIVSVNGTVGDLIGPASATARPTIEQMLLLLTGRIDDSALGQALKEEIQRLDSLTSALNTETSDRWNQYVQLQTDLGAYQNDVDGVATLVADEVVRLDSSDTAQVNQINVIAAKSGDNAAAVVAEQTARADADSALAQSVTTLQSTLGDEIAQVETNAQTDIDTLNGEVTNIGALYTTKVNVNGLIGGFGIYNDGSEVLAGFDVDTFFVGRTQANKVKPFIIKDGETFIDEAVIQSLTFNKLRADDGSLVFNNGKLTANYIDTGNLNVASAAVFSGDVTSEDFVRGQTGWQILKSGIMEINNLKARGNIDGSMITGSTIEGSVINGSAFVAPTEFGGNYVGTTSNLAWSDSGGTSAGGWVYSNYVNIRSGNYSNTNEYRRYRRKNIDAKLTLPPYEYNSYRIIVYKGNTAVVDTGHRDTAGYWSGTGWSLHIRNKDYEHCNNGCSGFSCTYYAGPGAVTFRLNNYYFHGNGRLRFRVYTRHASSYSVVTSAINDY